MSNPRDEISCFVMGVSKDLVEECREAMLHENMSISRQIVHAQKVEDNRLVRKNKEAKRAKSY